MSFAGIRIPALFLHGFLFFLPVPTQDRPLPGCNQGKAGRDVREYQRARIGKSVVCDSQPHLFPRNGLEVAGPRHRPDGKIIP